MTHDDLEGQSSLSLNDFDKVLVKHTKIEASIFNSFKIIQKIV